MFVSASPSFARKRAASKGNPIAFGRKTAGAGNRLEEFTGDDVADMIGFIGGTTLVSMQTTAPTSWTKGATHNDKALRLVTGAASSGGSVSFSTCFTSWTPVLTVGNTPLDAASMPVHTHTIPNLSIRNATATPQVQDSNAGAAGPTFTSSTSGSNSTHTHSMSAVNALPLAVQYVDGILIVKD
jgi:hypothetical protein